MPDNDDKFWNTIRYFEPWEFDSPNDVTSGLKMDHRFIEVLDTLRFMSGVLFHVNSGYRTASYNRRIEGSNNSAHLRGLAADISADISPTKHSIIKSCILLEVPRLGIYKDHIHIDVDFSLPHPIIWWGDYKD